MQTVACVHKFENHSCGPGVYDKAKKLCGKYDK